MKAVTGAFSETTNTFQFGMNYYMNKTCKVIDIICCHVVYRTKGYDTIHSKYTKINPSMTLRCDHEGTDTLSNSGSISYLVLPRPLF